MKVLITGVGGFAGSHLADYIINNSLAEVFGIVRDIEKNENIRSHEKSIRLFECDIVDFQSIFRILKEVKPDIIFHLAGQAVRSKFVRTYRRNI